jgi:hypothetical protein
VINPPPFFKSSKKRGPRKKIVTETEGNVSSPSTRGRLSFP